MAYTDEAGVRGISLETAVADPQLVSAALVAEALTWAEAEIDDYCGTSFEAKVFSVTLNGNGTNCIRLVSATGRTVMYPASVTSASVDGTALTSGELATLKLHRHGLVIWPDGIWASATGGQNVVIAGTAGITAAAPEGIVRATKLMARHYCLAALDRTHMGALQVTDDVGVTVLAQPGRHGPTTMPEVNTILKRWKRRSPGVA